METSQTISEERMAIQSGNLDLVKELVTDSSVVNKPDKRGWTLLHEAASKDQFADITRFLISAGAIVDSKTPKGVTPFYIACKEGCESIAKILIDAGCDINVPVIDFVSDKNCTNFTPLHIACYQGNLPIIKLLLENNVNVNAKDGRRRTSIHISVDNFNSIAVLMLIKAGANLKLRDSQGYTALHHASILGNLEMFNILVEHLGCEESVIDQQTPQGWTLLMLACNFQHYAIAERLIECKANTAIINCIGLLALHMAAHGELKLFKLLLLNTPNEAIDRYCSFRSDSNCYRSLPCIIIDNKAFDSLKLLYESGVSESVLKCPGNDRGRLISPIGHLLLYTNSWSDHGKKLKFLEFLLSHKFLINPGYGDELCPHNTISIFEAAVQMHSPYHENCHCEAFLSLILSKISSPYEGLPSTPSRQLTLFYKAARHGYVAALNLLKYSVIEPDDVMETFLEDISEPYYLWNGHEAIVVKFLLEKCITSFTSKISKLKKSRTEIIPEDRDQLIALVSVINALESNVHVASLKRMCRFVVRKQIRKEVKTSFLSFRSHLRNISLPPSLSKYLLYEMDF